MSRPDQEAATKLATLCAENGSAGFNNLASAYLELSRRVEEVEAALRQIEGPVVLKAADETGVNVDRVCRELYMRQSLATQTLAPLGGKPE